MKKVVYVVLVLLVLLGLSMLLQNNKPAETPVAEVAVEAPVAAEADVVVVDVEPTAEAAVAAEPSVEAAEAVEVVEENPEATADEGETVVEE